MIGGVLPDEPDLRLQMFDDSVNANYFLNQQVIVDDGAYYFRGRNSKYTLKLLLNNVEIADVNIDCTAVKSFGLC